MMETVVDALSWTLLVAGGAFVFIGGLGALRLPSFYTRMHAASLTDTMGTILILVGIMLQAGLSLATVKLAAILGFLLLTGPTASFPDVLRWDHRWSYRRGKQKTCARGWLDSTFHRSLPVAPSHCTAGPYQGPAA